MALIDKNIVITPNIGATSDPKIVFSGADVSTAAQNITLTAYPTNGGTLSFDGSAGQLFSVTNSMSGTIFSANDVSGIPSIEVLDTGLIKLGQYSGNIVLGTGTDNGAKLQVTGNVRVSSGSTNPIHIGQNTGATTYNSISLNGVTTDSGNMGMTGGGGVDTMLYINSTGNIRFRTNSFGQTPLELSSTGATILGNTALHAGNYNSYSPSLTGGSASGTWGISITGNAATLSNFIVSNSLNNGQAVASNYIGYINDYSGTALTASVADGALYSQYYSSSWQHEIYGDYRSGQIALRGKNSGTWQAWRTVLDSSNYNSYSPSLTGTSASGTWGISVTGNAATVGGFTPSQAAAVGNKVVVADVNGYIFNNYYNGTDEGTNGTAGTVTGIMTKRGDNYYRTTNAASVAAYLSGQTMNIVGTASSETLATVTGRGGTTTVASTFNGGLSVKDSILGTTTNAGGTFNLLSNLTGFQELNIAGGILTTGTDKYVYLGTGTGNAVSSTTTIEIGSGTPGSSTTIYSPLTVAGALKQGGNQVLHAGNYNSYSPTLTGTGASGTWGINISGNAASAAILQTARNINGTSFNGSANIDATEWIHSGRDFINGTLITTSINYSVADGDPFILQIRGNSYSGAPPFDIQLQGYIYSGTIINTSAYSIGPTFNIIAMNVGGVLCFWFARQSYWQGFNVHVYSAYATRAVNKVVSITDVVNPAGTKQVTFSPVQVLRSDNYNSYSPTLTGTGASGSWGINITGNAATATSLSGFGNPTTSSTANTIVYRESNGYITNNYFHTTGGGSERLTSGMGYFAGFNSSDYYIRSYTPAAVAIALSGQTMNIVGTATSVPLVSVDNSIAYGRSGLQFVNVSGLAGDVASTTNTPTADWWHIIRGNHANGAGYYTDLALPMTAATNIRYRRISAGTSSGWITVLDSTNYNSYSPTLTGTGASGTWGINITGNAGTAGTASNLISAAGIIQSTSSGTSYSNAIQVREATGGGSSTNMIYAPRLGFHWGGTVASSIAIEASGRIGIFNNPGGAYEAFVCGTLTATNFSGTSSGTNTGDNPGVTAVAGVTPIVSSGGTTPSISHALSGATAGTYNNVTVNTFGHVTAGSNVAYLTSYTEADTLATVTARGATTSSNITFSNGRKGLVGQYDASQTQAIFAMGAAYTLTDGGASNVYGGIYGLAWSYNPDYGGAGNNPQSKAGLNHQLLLMQNGVTTAALGSGVWTNGVVTGSSFTGAGTGLTGTASSLSIGGNAATVTNGLTTSNYNSYALPLSGGTLTGDITTYRAAAPTTGVIYLGNNSGTKYLYFDGTNYSMPGGQLDVNGSRVLNAGNYNSYSPSLTGTSASGTWGISITGNAATATNVAGIVQNSYTTYGNIASTTAKNGYYGYLMGSATSHLQIMADGSGNGGFYRQDSGWPLYYLAGNACVGIMTSTTSSSYALYVAGGIYATGNITAYSDARKKRDVVTIDNALQKTLALRGVYYYKINPLKDSEKPRQLGVIAQEVLEVVPEVVTYAEDVDEYGVSYQNMVGLLIEAIKEQQRIIDKQEERITRLENLVSKLIEG
jgi:hypothetical protein